MSAKYIFIARELEQMLLRSGENSKLPTEAELCAQYGCSRQTVRSALAVLEDRGLIVKRQGSGSYPARTIPAGNRKIAVILSDREEYLSPGLLRDIRREAQASDCSVDCYETNGSHLREREILTELLHHRPAGILMEPITDALGCFQEDLLAKLQIAGVPVVFLNGDYRAITGAIRVHADDEAGAATLISHLAAHGHKEISMLLKCDDSRGIARFRGAVRAASEAGIPLRQETILWYTEQERLRLLEGDDALLHRFLREYRRSCTAVICFNDEIAYRLLRVLPGERPLSVVSFDNSYLALSREPSITTLGHPDTTPGEAAVQALLRQTEGRGSGTVVLPWKLYVRKSG